MKNTFSFLSADVLSLWADELEILSNSADLSDVDSLDSLRDALENVEAYPVGVYAAWNDCVYRDMDDAVELLRHDKNAFEAALSGWLTLEDYPHVRNEYKGYDTPCSGKEACDVQCFLSKLRDDTL